MKFLKVLGIIALVCVGFFGLLIATAYFAPQSDDDGYYEEDAEYESSLTGGYYDEDGEYRSSYSSSPPRESEEEYQARLERERAPLTPETAQAVYRKSYDTWQQRQDDEHYRPNDLVIVDFGRVMVAIPETETDFRTVWNEADESSRYYAMTNLIDFYRLPSDRFRRELEEMRSTRLVRIRSTGFDPSKSYRSSDGSRLDPSIPWDKGCGSCNDLESEALKEMVWLCRTLGLTDKERVWKRHLADYYWTAHGYYGSRQPELAAEIYRELGEEEFAILAHQAALRAATEAPINRFLTGRECIDCGWDPDNQPRSFPMYQLEDLEEVYRLLTEAEASKEEIRKEILPLIEAAVAADIYEVAKRGFEMVGDQPNVTRMALLVGGGGR